MHAEDTGLATERLYWQDAAQLTFSGVVIGASSYGKRPSITLDRSAFYPEAGGQMGDRGVLRFKDGDGSPNDDGQRIEVVDVQVDEAGVVHHIVDVDTSLVGIEIGTNVQGAIDATRRKEFAALHTGQHLLSSALLQVLGAETVSSRLGETGCNIDLDRDAVSDAKASEAEALVNQVIDDSIAVRQYFPTPSELAALTLRRAPKVTSGIRVVTVGDFDVTPCGGTHVDNSAEIGLVRVSHVERAKGKARVMFEAGPRARSTLFGAHALLRDLAREMTCADIEVSTAIAKMRQSLSAQRSALTSTQKRLSELESQALLRKMHDEKSLSVVSHFDADATFLRLVAPQMLQGGAQLVVLTAKNDDGVAIFCGRGQANATFDCGAFIKELTKECGGRGGGKAERAEGRLPKDVDLERLLQRVGAATS